MRDISQMREPTAKERVREKTIRNASIADSLITVSQVIVGLTSGSLTMLGDSVRAVIMLMVEFYSLWILKGIHRNKFHRFQFGTGKLEQFIVLVVGTAIVVVGLWFSNTTITRLFTAETAPSPLGLAFAAVVNGVNLMINLFTWYAMYRNRHYEESDVYKAQVKSRTVKVVNSAVLQITLTIAALATDALVALIMDTLGAGFVSLFLLYNGVRMMARSVPHLLDSPLPEGRLAKIAELSKIAEEHAVDIIAIRTRQSGRTDHVEITVAMAGHFSLEQLREKLAVISGAIKNEISDIDLSIVIQNDGKALPQG